MMNFKSFFKELKRRNIYKVAVTYAITGWVIMEIATSVFPALEFPEWTTQFVIILVLIGFPFALVFAWAFEITPEGIKRTREVPVEDSITHQTGRKLNYWIIGLLGLALVLVLSERIWWAGTYNSSSKTSTSQAQTAENKASVAVLPFDDYSPKGNQQWFSDGLTEEILNSLARLPELQVPARTSSFLFRDSQLPIPEIADSLNVNHVVEGSVRRSGNQMRITAQLIRGNDGNHVWSNTYDVSTDSVFKIQQDIAEEIASALDVYLDEEKRNRMFAFGTRDVAAYEAFLKGRAIFNAGHQIGNLNFDTLWTANKRFEKAMHYDPQFAAPYYYHQDAYVHFLAGQISAPKDTLSERAAYNTVQSDLQTAINISPNKGEKIIYRLEKTFLSNQWDQVPQLFQKLKQNQEAQQAFVRLGGNWTKHLAIFAGQAKLMKRLGQRLIDRNPLSAPPQLYNTLNLMALENYDAASSGFDKIEEMTGEKNVGRKIIFHLMADQHDSLRSIIPKDSENGRLLFKILSGEKTLTNEKKQALKIEANFYNLSSIILHAAGNTATLNRKAAQVDSTLFGPQGIAVSSSFFGGILLFNPEATPNLKQRLEEADIEVEPYRFAGQKAYKIVQKEL
jgi:TolB-like protein